MASSRLPTIFISHGSPMHALEAGAAGDAWAAIGRDIPHPRAIVIASAHWETDRPMLTGSTAPQTIHDFYGFPAPLYNIRYPAPGSPDIASRARSLLSVAGFTVALDAERGLDHGAWSPLLHMYPDAQIPVVQLSVQSHRGARHHLALGRALAPLGAEEVLVIGSGHMTHNLREWMRGAIEGVALMEEFRDWIGEHLTAGDYDALVDYRSQAPHAERAHPTEEHFLPLFIAAGAAGELARAERVFNGMDRVLAMDAYVFYPRTA